MLKHLFKIIWNKRQSNFMLILQIFLSFMVVFVLATLGTELLINYKKPLGFQYQNAWVLYLNWPITRHPETNLQLYSYTPEEIREIVKQIKYRIESYEEVVGSVTSSHYDVPFYGWIGYRDIEVDNRNLAPECLSVDDQYASFMGIEIVEGRWFQRGDNGAAFMPVVIDQTMREKFFPNEEVIGKKLAVQHYTDNAEIIGVIGDYKHKGDFSRQEPLMFLRFNLESTDSIESLPLNNLIFRVKEGTGAKFEARLWEDVQKISKGDWYPYISYLEDERGTNIKRNLIPIIILSIVSGFLILNTMLGLFGVLWYNISRRYAEIGLRRAVGANRPNIQWQFIGEMVIAATLAISLGCLFAIQFPILDVFDIELRSYLLGIIGAILLIYALIVVCSFYPSRVASQIQPATALHEE